MTDARILEAVYDAVETETRRIGSALGACRRTTHSLGPPGDLIADLGPKTERGRTVTLRRHPHEREGSRERRTVVSRGVDEAGMPTKALLAGVRRLVDPIDRMIRREAAIMTLGDEVLAADGFLCPKWSYSAHPVLIAMMNADRYDAQDLVRLNYRMSAAGPILDREPDHIMTYGDPTPYGNGTKVKGEIRLDVIDAEVYEHRAGPISVNYMSGKGYHARLCIGGTSLLPETVLPSLKGMALDDVIRHPAWGGSVPGAVIHEATNNETYMMLTMRPALAPLAQAPDGMDTSWRTIIS